MICKRCNSDTPDNSIFCKHCGCRIGSNSSSNNHNNYNRTYNFLRSFISQIQNLGEIKEILTVLVFSSGFLISFVLVSAFMFSIQFLSPTSTVKGVKELNMEKVIELSAKGAALTWEDFDGYGYSLREERLIPNYQKREYVLRCSLTKYDGIEIEVEGDITKEPTDINICFYESDGEGFRSCKVEGDLRNSEDFDKILETYKEVTKNKSDGMMEYRYNFRND